MQEALIALLVLVFGVVVGAFLQPTEAMLRPLDPDELNVPGVVPEEPHHH